MNATLLRTYVRRGIVSKVLSDYVKRLNKDQETAEARLMDELIDAAVDNIRHDASAEHLQDAEALADEWLAPVRAEIIQALVDGSARKTVYVYRQWWLSPIRGDNGEADYERTVKAMRESGIPALASLIEERFNTHSASAWLREQLPDGEPLGDPDIPEIIKANATISRRDELRMRKAGS